MEAGQIDAVPARQSGNVVEARPALDALRQLPAGRRVRQAAHHRLHASRQKLRRQDVQQLGGAGGIGVHVAPHVQPLLPGLLQQSQHLRNFLPPAVPAHGLQVGDLQGDTQGTGHRQHLPDGIHHPGPLLPHMHRHRHVAAAEGPQGLDQLLGGIEALRGIAQPQRHAHGAVRECPFHTAVDGVVMALFQSLEGVARRIRPQNAGPRQHPRVDGGRGLRGKIPRQRLRLHLRRGLPGDGGQIGQYFLPVRRAEGGGGQTAVAVYNGGQPLPQLQLSEAGTEGRRIGMAMDIDEARCHQLPGGIHHPSGRGIRRQRLHSGDDAALYRHVGGKAGGSGAVDDGAAPDQQVQHGHCAPFWRKIGSVTEKRFKPS